MVRAFVAAADTGGPGTWNIGTGMETSVLELIDVIAEITGRTVMPELAPARTGELLRSAVASGLAGQDLGWRAPTPLTDGIRNVYRWIEAGAPVRAES